jgi:hypothetical protein
LEIFAYVEDKKSESVKIMPKGKKSPLHPSALAINGLTPGRTIVKFNRHIGTMGTFVILEYPCVRNTAHGRGLMVRMRDIRSGTTKYHYLTDMGVVPLRSGRFNGSNYIVDRRKVHLLPEPTGEKPRGLKLRRSAALLNRLERPKIGTRGGRRPR